MDLFSRLPLLPGGALNENDPASAEEHYSVPMDKPHEAGHPARSIYDAKAQYPWPDREYDPPDPWFEGMQMLRTQPIGSGPPEPPDPPSRPEYLLLTDELMERLLADLREPEPLEASPGIEDGHGFLQQAGEVS